MKTQLLSIALFGLFCMPLANADDGQCECPIQAAKSKLPQLTYLVGTKALACPKSAAELSKKEGLPIKYVIAQTYNNEAAATLAMAEKTESLVQQLVSMKKCEVSGKFTVGGKTTHCSKEAAATAKRLRSAVDAVTVSYKVGEKVCDCPIESKQLAAKSDSKIVFVVDGQETTCPNRHRLNEARAKYRAAVEALARVDSQPTS